MGSSAPYVIWAIVDRLNVCAVSAMYCAARYIAMACGLYVLIAVVRLRVAGVMPPRNYMP